MSRFDNELTKTAWNAWQQSGAPGPIQQHYDQTTLVGTEPAVGVTQAPPAANEVKDWVADTPMSRQLQVTDLNAADPGGEIMWEQGSSAIWAEGGPMYASVDDSLYSVYKASREIRDAIDAQEDFDFGNLFTAATQSTNFVRTATDNSEVIHAMGTIAGLVNDIENDLATDGNYRQAYKNLEGLESLLDTINKTAADGDDDGDGDSDSDSDGDGDGKKKKMEASVAQKIQARKDRLATNGNQETLQVVDVRDLDDAAGVWDLQKVMTPDHHTEVEVPEYVNGMDAGYVPYYNDGASTGVTPQVDHDRNPWPYDGTNPALMGYAGTVASTTEVRQAAREKIFEALQVVERLEKLGMVQEGDRAKHIAKFEQMSDAKLEGFKTSLTMLEESGARQPRSQKVASIGSRLPEMGRMTTASAVTRQDVSSDDWLMTL